MSERLRRVQINTKKINWGVIIAIYLVQIIVFQIMNHVTFPIIQEHLDGVKMFDMMKQGYDVSIAREILANMGEHARHTYLVIQMPLDFLYPCIMAFVYYLVLVKTSERFRYCYYLFPMLLVVFDWMENCCIILMLRGCELSNLLVTWSSTCTRLKVVVGDYILYFATILSLVMYVVKYIMPKIKDKR